MPKYTSEDVIKTEVPPNLNESLILRCLEAKFGMSSNEDPMITSKWEILGVKNGQNSVDDTIVRGGKQYKIAGIEISCWQVLSQKALHHYEKFWLKAHPGEKFEVDTDNPDIGYYKGLIMSARVLGETTERRTKVADSDKADLKEQLKNPELTKEEKAALQEAMKGQIIIDEETGKPEKVTYCKIDGWNSRFNGEVPQF